MPIQSSNAQHVRWMDRALRLAKRGYGNTSPNPMVGAVLVRDNLLLGEGWHRRAGGAHAEIEAIHDATAKGHSTSGADLYVTLEPCSTTGRTPPCTDAIVAAGIARVFIGATDPNPRHSGRGYRLLEQANVQVIQGLRAEQAAQLNEGFNHWIVQRTPWVTVKAALSLDGKIATTSGESRWITSPRSRAYGMSLRQGADAILVGVNTILADDPKLTVRRGEKETGKPLRRIVLDSLARTPVTAHVLSDGRAQLTTVVVSDKAPGEQVAALAKRGTVWLAPAEDGRIDVEWLLKRLGDESVLNLLVEGGGEVNASFILGGWAHRVAFFYAPKIMGGRSAPGAVGGAGVETLAASVSLRQCQWRRLGTDLLLTGLVAGPQA
jgi:diaminohydroxyphosphoribosylaminopyrimidine deaminase / 5-amino-6-(5-phosphoribosylamino)uracil reductase